MITSLSSSSLSPLSRARWEPKLGDVLEELRAKSVGLDSHHTQREPEVARSRPRQRRLAAAGLLPARLRVELRLERSRHRSRIRGVARPPMCSAVKATTHVALSIALERALAARGEVLETASSCSRARAFRTSTPFRMSPTPSSRGRSQPRDPRRRPPHTSAEGAAPTLAEAPTVTLLRSASIA
jgi:hypothetical protein